MLRMDDDHVYWSDDVRVPGVNEIAKALGLIDTSFMTDEGADRGKRRHELLEDYDNEKLDWGNVQPEDAYVLVGWREFLEDTGFRVQGVELPVYHSGFHYAGTIDRVLEGDQTYIVDIKTGSSIHPWHRLQVALYALAYADAFDTSIPRMGIVHIREAKKRQYSWKEVSEPFILESAFSIVQSYHWQQKNWEWATEMHQWKLRWLDDLVKELEDGSNIA